MALNPKFGSIQLIVNSDMSKSCSLSVSLLEWDTRSKESLSLIFTLLPIEPSASFGTKSPLEGVSSKLLRRSFYGFALLSLFFYLWLFLPKNLISSPRLANNKLTWWSYKSGCTSESLLNAFIRQGSITSTVLSIPMTWLFATISLRNAFFYESLLSLGLLIHASVIWSISSKYCVLSASLFSSFSMVDWSYLLALRCLMSCSLLFWSLSTLQSFSILASESS